MLSGIKLITFDLDDTLWPCLPTILKAEAEMYDWLKLNAPAITANLTIEGLREHRRKLALSKPEIRHDLTRQRLLSLKQLMTEYGYDHVHAVTANKVFRKARNQVEPYDDVLPALNELKVNFILVSLTNGNSQIQHTPLHDSFHLSISAEMVGAAKPDPTMFYTAMQHAEVSPQQTLHVGDDPVRDIVVAQKIGLRTAWVNRNNEAWPDDLMPANFVISNLKELV